MARWLGAVVAVLVLVLAYGTLSCLAGDGWGAALGGPEATVSEPGVAPEVPVGFEVDHVAPGPAPVLTR